MRHSSLQKAKPTLLFLHGIGDSSLSYLPYLQAPALSCFNILIPDLLGYGENLKSNDYHFNTQIKDIIAQLRTLEHASKIAMNDVILIPHSMAGIHAMLLCQSELRDQIKGCINVEGSITQYGSFISEKAAAEHRQGNFNAWLDTFINSCRLSNSLYYQSLILCNKNAFLQNALEIQQFCHAGTGKYTNIAGQQFSELRLPKIYCHGDGLCQESLDFLRETKVETKAFHTNSHFVMQTCYDEFSTFVYDWVNKATSQKDAAFSTLNSNEELNKH